MVLGGRTDMLEVRVCSLALTLAQVAVPVGDVGDKGCESAESWLLVGMALAGTAAGASAMVAVGAVVGKRARSPG